MMAAGALAEPLGNGEWVAGAEMGDEAGGREGWLDRDGMGWLDGRGWASGTEYQRRAEGAARAERGEIRKGEI